MGRHYQKAWHCIRSCRQLRLAVIRQSDAVMTSLFPSVTVLPSVFSENEDDSSVCSLLWMTLVENRVNTSVLIQLKQYHLKCLHVYVKNECRFIISLVVVQIHHNFKYRVCTELRKTCSRLAARSRRKKESQLFEELTALLPLDPNMDGQRDKASVVRLTIAYLHLRGLLNTPDNCTQSSPPSPGRKKRAWK